MADEEYEQPSAEQKLSIASYFIMSSPTGEVQDVLIDVAKLVGDTSILTDEKIKAIMKSYNEEQLQPAVNPDGRSVVVSSFCAVGAADEYLDPSTGKVLKFDHRKHAFTSETEHKQVLAEGISTHRTAIEKQMDDYQENQYKGGKCTITTFGADDGNITICISARNVKLNSYWAGGWRTICTINVGTKGTAELKTNTKLNVHYFEDGNVQLHGAIEKTASINVQDPASTAEAIRKAISTIESDFQENLNKMYIEMHRSTFKLFRRFLPVTKQPMQWNQYAHQIKSDLGSK